VKNAKRVLMALFIEAKQMSNQNETQDASVAKLLGMLTYRRPHGFSGEILFAERFIYPHNPRIFTDPDGEILAYVVTVYGVATDVLWSCHVDTVDPATCDPVGRPVMYDAEFEVAWCEEEILGADDCAGVWLMLEMIEAKVPGTYIFHRGEERGGVGSKGMSTHHGSWLSTFTHAIAFDRRDTTSIITHQGFGRCCSDEFARERLGMAHMPDSTGIYTDTAECTKLIGECSNVSVGYEGEHLRGEMLDVGYLLKLRDALIAMDCSNLVVSREPGEIDLADDTGFVSRWTGHSETDFTHSDDTVIVDADWFANQATFREVVQFVQKADPEEVADLLIELSEKIIYQHG